MERSLIGNLNEKEKDKKVLINGWVDTIRDQGKVIFLDIRDISGIVQTVIFGKHRNLELAKKVTKESPVEIVGKVALRPKGTENPNIPTGKIELQIEDFRILNLSPPMPFELDKSDLGEEVRLKYRYLDLRRKKMKDNLFARAKTFKIMREYLDSLGFHEFETPMLVKYTPGGARNFLVPSRQGAGKFWALPESPQLFKQLLMVAGMERYYQIARCLRDEDLRKDRQPEFTQLDMEMSFINQEDIIKIIEGLLKKLWKEVLGVEVKTPFLRMTYDEAMKKHGNDRPDIRKDKNNPNEFAFLWVVDFPLFQYDKEAKKYVANHHPFTSPNMEDWKKKPETARSVAYDIVLNGVEIGGGSIRIHDSEVQQKVFEILKISREEQEKRFKFLLDALRYAPPHGGIALGIDRLMQLMLNLESIREAIPFPKNTEGREAMLDAPSTVTDEQLKDIHVKIAEPQKEGKKPEKKEEKKARKK